MRFLFRALLSLALILFCSLSYAQEKLELIESGAIIARASSLISDKEYDNALTALDSIPENDTNFSILVYYKGKAYQKQKNWEAAEAIYNKGIALKDGRWRLFLCELAKVKVLKGDKEAGFDVFNKAMELFPLSHNIYVDRAEAYVELGEYQKAVADYQKAIEINPFATNAHFELGKLCAKEGKYTQAFMGIIIGLLSDPTSNPYQTFEIYKYLNDTMLTSDYGLDKQGRDLHPSDENKFTQLDAAIKNRVVIDKKYYKKTKYKGITSIGATLHLLVNNLKYSASDKGWWMQTYVPILKEMLANKTDDEAYYLSMYFFFGKESWMSKKLTAVRAFNTWFRKEWSKKYTPREISLNGSTKTYDIEWSSTSSGVKGIGNIKNEVADGPWIGFNAAGSKSSEGTLKDGMRHGEWTEYNISGLPESKYSYKEGSLFGPYEIFHDNGKVKYRGTIEDGKLNEKWERFYYTGGLETSANYNSGTLSGPYTIYYATGAKFASYAFLNGELQGEYKTFHSNGKVSYEATYKEGEREGVVRKYYNNGQMSEDLIYKNGELEGPFKTFHITGKLMEEGKYKKGSRAGLCKEYYANGNLSSEINYDESGKQNGTIKYYSRDGKLYNELTLKRGEIIAYKFFNPEGDVIKEDTRKKGAFYYEGVYPDGIRSAKGKYEIGEVGEIGEWVYYNENGQRTRKEYFDEDGLLHNERIYFYRNGQISAKYDYTYGQPDGYFVSYYADGKMSKQGWYVEGSAQGEWIAYYRDGTISEINFYVNDQLNGIQKLYGVDGKLNRTYLYHEGELMSFTYYDLEGNAIHTAEFSEKESQMLTKYYNGKDLTKFTQLNHYYHGPSVGYEATGQKSYEGEYFYDERHGPWKWYHLNNQVSSEGNYFYGEMHGTWKEYHENGTLSESYEYIYGVLNGKSTEYYDNGKKKLEEFYVDGELNGKRVFYSPDEEVSMIRYYNHGKIIGYGYHDKNGKEVEMKKLPNETGKVKCYFPNGQVSREYTLDSGVFVGNYITYYSNGKMAYQTDHKDGYEHGAHKEYYKNGNLKSESTSDMGSLVGTKTTYRENGTKEKETPYNFDVQHGTVKYYNASGKVVKEEIWYNGDIMEVKNL